MLNASSCPLTEVGQASQLIGDKMFSEVGKKTLRSEIIEFVKFSSSLKTIIAPMFPSIQTYSSLLLPSPNPSHG